MDDTGYGGQERKVRAATRGKRYVSTMKHKILATPNWVDSARGVRNQMRNDTAYKIVPNASRPSRHAWKLPTASAKLSPRGIWAMMKAAHKTSQCNNASLPVPEK